MSFGDLLTLIVPEVILVVTAFVVLGVDLAALRGHSLARRRAVALALTVLGGLLTLVWLSQEGAPGRHSFEGGLLVIDPLGALVKQILVVLTLFTALLAADSDFTEHVGEYFALLLLATVGMLFLVSAENLLMIFLALELLSLSLYIMTAFNKHDVHSAEAALKYFLFGGMAAAFLLFGMSLLYGVTGTLNLQRMTVGLGTRPLDPLLLAAVVMVITGFGFKVAAVPYHLWAPDTYQGAPIPSAAFIASGSKVASFYILAKVLAFGLGGAAGSGAWQALSQGWAPVLAVVVLLSVVVGNLAALAQRSVRRLLAYSAVGHAGYMLLAVLAQNDQGLSSLLYYVATYALTAVGAFAVVAVVQRSNGNDQLDTFAGLGQRAPWLSFCMLIFMLSLAGIPPLAGFFGKFYLFLAALAGAKSLGLLWLVAVAVAMSAVSLYYYLQVLKQIYVAPPPENAPALQSGWPTQLTIGALAVAVVLLGCAPSLLVARLQAALEATHLFQIAGF